MDKTVSYDSADPAPKGDLGLSLTFTILDVPGFSLHPRVAISENVNGH
jgi:hypothetical protein